MDNVNWKKIIIEFIGTFVFLSVIINVAFNKNGGIMAPVAIGFALMTAIYLFNADGDNHFNPAVSFMAWMNGNIVLKVFLLYIVAQFIGSAVAFGCNRLISTAHN